MSNPTPQTAIRIPKSEIQELEELAANAWPAREVQHLDGWLLRANGGVTGRANSVLPQAVRGRVSMEERLAIAEEFYTRRGLPTLVQVTAASQPENLDALLDQRGYGWGMNVAIQAAPLAPLFAAPPDTEPEIRVSEGFSDAWYRTYCEADAGPPERSAVRADIYRRIAPRTRYVELLLDGRPAAVGLGVLERGWLGLFSIATVHAFRRRGAATAVIRALAEWAAVEGAAGAYLQVGERNAPALALYERLGFRTLYHYHYRKKALASP